MKVTTTAICGSDLHMYDGWFVSLYEPFCLLHPSMHRCVHCSLDFFISTHSFVIPSVLAQPGMKKGDVLGHEFMGYVEDVGSEVQSVKVGDRVVVSCLIFCGECRFCKNQEYSLCDM